MILTIQAHVNIENNLKVKNVIISDISTIYLPENNAWGTRRVRNPSQLVAKYQWHTI